jgi:hypothetical protein
LHPFRRKGRGEILCAIARIDASPSPKKVAADML